MPLLLDQFSDYDPEWLLCWSAPRSSWGLASTNSSQMDFHMNDCCHAQPITFVALALPRLGWCRGSRTTSGATGRQAATSSGRRCGARQRQRPLAYGDQSESVWVVCEGLFAWLNPQLMLFIIHKKLSNYGSICYLIWHTHINCTQTPTNVFGWIRFFGS
jgi:hypothetical protein